MSSDRDDPRGKIHKAGQTFVFDFSKSVAGPKSPESDAAETFTIPSFLRTGPAGGGRRTAPAPGKAAWLDEDFARIAQTAKPQPRDPARESVEPRLAEPSPAPDAAPAPTVSVRPETSIQPEVDEVSAAAPEQMPKEEAAPVSAATHEVSLEVFSEPAAAEFSSPESAPAEMPTREQPKAAEPKADVQPDLAAAPATATNPDIDSLDEAPIPDASFRAAKPAWQDGDKSEPLRDRSRKRQAPQAPSAYIGPESDEIFFRPSTSAWTEEERREPVWSGPRDPDRQWEEDWRRLGIRSIDDDEGVFVPPAATRRRKPVSSVTWLLLIAAVAAGGYGFMQARREAAPADTNQLAMLTPNESMPAVLPSQPVQAVPPVGLRATVPDRSPTSSAIVPSPAAPKAPPRKTADEALVPHARTGPPRYVEKRSVMSEPHSRPEESTRSHVVLAPGPHPLTAPSSYEAARGGAVLASFASDIQARLILLGYSAPRSGVLDAETRRAIRLFQTNSGLPATGEVDSQTLDRLNSVSETQVRLVKGPDSITPP